MTIAHKTQTKVIWSFDSKLLNRDLMAKISSNPVDGVRLVYSQNHVAKVESFINDFAQESFQKSDHKRALILDLSEGARASISHLDTATEIAFGEQVKFFHESAANAPKSSTAQGFLLKTQSWDSLFKEGVFVFVGYGHAVLKTLRVSANEVVCEVIQGGTIFPDTEIHVPDTRLKPTLNVFSEPIKKALAQKRIDYLILPGVANATEITAFKETLRKWSEELPWIILRVDSKAIYDKLPDLIDEVDGIFISRRELALTMHPSSVVVYTKEMTQLANDRAKVVMTASEMLGSMRRSPTPTRAEVSDIANAISDGTDSVVLSEEVAQGEFSDRAIEVMHKIILDTESQTDQSLNWIKLTPKVETEMDAIAHGAYLTAERVKAKAIVCLTVAGNTALKLSSFRTPVPIIAVTFSEFVLRKLSLIRGVQSIVLDGTPKLDEVLPVVNERLLRNSWLKAGDKFVFVSITLSSLSSEHSNIFTVQHLQ